MVDLLAPYPSCVVTLGVVDLSFGDVASERFTLKIVGV